MTRVSNATPLIALDAFVIDTETTGLDPARRASSRSARCRLRPASSTRQAALRRLVNPGEPIPALATQIHKIDDAAVADAPNFAAVWPELAAAISGSVLIGHTLGFDLAVLKRECERAGLPWTAPRTLDTRLLAQVAEPNLGGYTLEHLASWLDVTIDGRHSAVADARHHGQDIPRAAAETARGNIRTLAEAEQACLALTGVLDEQHRAGWEAGGGAAARARGAHARAHRYLSLPPSRRRRHERAAEIHRRRCLARRCAAAHGAGQDFLACWSRPLASDAALRARDTAIITERDVLRALAEQGADALARPVAQFCQQAADHRAGRGFRLSRARPHEPAQAAPSRRGKRERRSLRHRHVARPAAAARAGGDRSSATALDRADDVPALGAAWARLPQAAAGLLAEGVSARDVAAVISRELGALTRRAGVLAERRMKADGTRRAALRLCAVRARLGRPRREPARHGSGQCHRVRRRRAGRGRGSLVRAAGRHRRRHSARGRRALLQGRRDGQERAVARLARDLARAHRRLDRALQSRRSAVGRYLLRSDRGAWRRGLANEIWRGAFDAAAGNAGFAKLLAEAAGEVEPGINIWGGLRTENGRIDLKRAGLFGIVTAARVLAIRHHLLERSTPARLAAIAGARPRRRTRSRCDLTRAQGSVPRSHSRRSSLPTCRTGLPPGNKVAVKRLSREQRTDVEQIVGGGAPSRCSSRAIFYFKSEWRRTG